MNKEKTMADGVRTTLQDGFLFHSALLSLTIFEAHKAFLEAEAVFDRLIIEEIDPKRVRGKVALAHIVSQIDESIRGLGDTKMHFEYLHVLTDNTSMDLKGSDNSLNTLAAQLLAEGAVTKSRMREMLSAVDSHQFGGMLAHLEKETLSIREHTISFRTMLQGPHTKKVTHHLKKSRTVNILVEFGRLSMLWATLKELVLIMRLAYGRKAFNLSNYSSTVLA